VIGAVVAVSGLIGFVGLFIPHMVRLTMGSDHRLVLPASALVGGGFLVLADTLARTLLASSALQTELPVGVITALIGGPVFVWLLRREMRR
jgi:iron complex transport system permease protein